MKFDPRSTGRLVRFRYVNYHGREHEYLIGVESVEIGAYTQTGMAPDGELAVVLHGWVVTRDGDVRGEMGTRRRTFMVSGIRNLELVDPAEQVERKGEA